MNTEDLTKDLIKDLIEQFADGEPVSPDALVAALATAEGREHLRGLLELRALMADAPVVNLALVTAPKSPWLSVTRIAAAALLAAGAAAAGYVAGTRELNGTAGGTRIETVENIEPVAPPPAPTTVIKLDATQGWRDQRGGF